MLAPRTISEKFLNKSQSSSKADSKTVTNAVGQNGSISSTSLDSDESSTGSTSLTLFTSYSSHPYLLLLLTVPSPLTFIFEKTAYEGVKGLFTKIVRQEGEEL